MEIRLLGPLEVLDAKRLITPTAPKVRRVLALLALNANRPVGTHRLVEELWGDRPPMSWSTTLQTYIYQLRKWMNDHATAGQSLDTRPGGYQLSMPEGCIDLFGFRKMSAAGIAELGSGQHRTACRTLESAMSLWRDRALDDLHAGPLLETEIARLHSQRRMTLEAWLDAQMLLGRHHDVVTTTEVELAQDPTNENLCHRLITALYHCGRRRDALEKYHQIRVALAHELGLDPSPELRDLHRAVLADKVEPPADGGTDQPGPVEALPAHLPPDCQQVGRESELSWFRELLRNAPMNRPVVVSVVGQPGVGATAFCTHAAHGIRSNYPDGQFYADVGNTDDTANVLRMFLHAIGMDDRDIPADTADRQRAFRSWTADRRVLVVLNGVASTEQLKQLLPTGPGSLTIVASHHRLCGHELNGTIRLKPLTANQSRELLNIAVPVDLLDSEPAATARLIELCAGSPTMLWAAAAQLQSHPHWNVARVLQRAKHDSRTPEAVVADGLDITRSFGDRCRMLPAAALSALHRIGLNPGPLSPTGAASLIGVDIDAAEEILDHLVDYQLADVDYSPATLTTEARIRYRVHPFVFGACRGLFRPSIPLQRNEPMEQAVAIA